MTCIKNFVQPPKVDIQIFDGVSIICIKKTKLTRPFGVLVQPRVPRPFPLPGSFSSPHTPATHARARNAAPRSEFGASTKRKNTKTRHCGGCAIISCKIEWALGEADVFKQGWHSATRASRPKAIITWLDDFTRVVAHPVFVDEADRTGRNFWGDNGAVNVLPNTHATKIDWEGKPFDNPAFLTPSSTSPFALKMLNPQLNQHCGHWLDKLIEKDHLFKLHCTERITNQRC